MTARSSKVGYVRLISAQLGSILQAGDCFAVSPRSQVFAVQRQVSEYEGNEGNLKEFRIFSQNIPEPVIDEEYSVTTTNRNKEIAVGSLQITGLSAASVIQIGSNRVVDTENRTINIRQLLKGRRPV